MQASDISHLAGELEEYLGNYKTNDKVIAGCLGGSGIVVELISCLGKITSLVSGAQRDLQKCAGEIDKEWEKGVKCGLYKLEYLFMETREFLEYFRIPRFVLDSLINSTTEEAENILKKLILYSQYKTVVTYDHLSPIRERLNKDKLIKLVLDPRARPVIAIPLEGEAGYPHLARLIFDDSPAQNHFSLLSWVSMSDVKRHHEVPSLVVHSLRTVNGVFGENQYSFQESESAHECLPEPPATSWGFSLNDNEECPEKEGFQESESAHKCLPEPPAISWGYFGEEDYQGSYKKEGDLIEQLKELVSEKKCLLVLDNVSGLLIDDLLVAAYYRSDKCPFFSDFCKATADGSKILITYRGPSKHLEPLDQDSSWALFKNIALERKGEVQEANYLLSEIGHKICRKCDNVQAVIKIIASILSTRYTVEEWEHFHDIVLAGIEDLPGVVLQTIADPLPFCSLFSKDYEFKEDDLIAEYGLGSRFDEFLVKGYFLKDDKREGGIPEVTYKMNYLTYVLMKHVAGYEYCLVDKCSTEVNHEIIRHVSFVVDSSWQAPSWLANARQLKSLLFRPSKSGEVVAIPNIDLSHLRGLRILDFGTVHCESLQYFLGELTNLTYLRLGAVLCKSVPQSITTLRNLKTLNLRHSGVTVLPMLKKLTCLYAGDNLTDLLPTLVKLQSLRRIDVLKVDEDNWSVALGLLKLITMVGNLIIVFEKDHVLSSVHDRLSLSHVIDVSLAWSSSYGENRKWDFWMPSTLLRSLTVSNWKREKFPASMMNNLSNIVSVQLLNCRKCQHLPAFRKLPHLATLKLWGLNSLEYIETVGDNGYASSSTAYFRSLKYLVLGNLPVIKRWSKNEDDCRNLQQWCLPLLSELYVSACPQLMTMPPMPTLESLEAINIHGKLLQRLLCSQVSAASSLISSTCPTLKKLHIISICELDSITTKQLAGILQYSLSFLEELEIDRCEELDWDMNLNDIDGIKLSPVEDWQGLKMLRSVRCN